MIVQVKQGLLEGRQKASVLTGKPFYEFLGIPYAKPPIGDLRFQPPVPADSWKGVRQSMQEVNKCAQSEKLYEGDLCGSEDCLYLNIFIPGLSDTDTRLKAVMIYIHGGGFSQGRSALECDFLMGNDVIVVTLNYRLGILGFLNLNIPECSGNVGLKDQSLALTWIKENIQSFRGDSNNITLFGDSAGASSIHLQALSPMSKGLFQRIITESGNALAPWTINDDPEKCAFDVGLKLGFTGNNPKELFEFLKKQSVNDLVMAAKVVSSDFKNTVPAKCRGLVFVPSVEKISKNAFLPDHPISLLKTVTPVPAIAGVAEIEGILIYAGLKNKEELDYLPNDLTDAIKYNVQCHPSRIPEIADKAKEFYFGTESINKRKHLLEFFSDIFFIKLYNAFEDAVKSDIPVYMYKFTFVGKLNGSQKFCSELKTACHADEIGYLFPESAAFPQAEYKNPERTVIMNICKLWTNFAKTGNPNTAAAASSTVEWKPLTIGSQSFLNIDKDLKIFPGKVYPRLEFWSKLLDTNMK